jgi:uncharacterized protein (AIM24 family)
MNVRRRQVLVELNNTSCKLQAGAMQWMLGNVSMQSGVSAGNFLGKALGAAVTGETMAKPEYTGQGYVMLEPTYKHILLVDVAQWVRSYSRMVYSLPATAHYSIRLSAVRHFPLLRSAERAYLT